MKVALQDIIQGLDFLPVSVSNVYAEMLRHVARAVGQAVVSAAPASVAGVVPSVVAPVPATDPAQAVLAAAEAEWRRGVAEPGTPNMPNGAIIIDDYIRGPLGLGWNTCDVKTWKPGVPYTRNGQFAWCGAFAARCWAAAGLKLELRQKYLAGTGRLYRWAHADSGLRYVKPENIQPGDIVVIGPSGSTLGEHIAIAECLGGPDAQGGTIVYTYEGNAHGPGPGELEYEGVIHRSRPFFATAPAIYRVLYGVRPLASDLVTA